MFETYASGILFLGILLTLIGLVWVIIRAYRVSKGWGLGCTLFPPTVLPFALFHYRRAAGPLLMLGLGLLAAGGTIAVNRFIVSHLSLGPHEKKVDGELHITLTGWDLKDYSLLKDRDQTVVLQMANPDVTDETLDFIEGMKHLRELDLNDTQVTDAGLAKIARFPDLQILRLRGTKVTDEGFGSHLKAKEKLQEIDARETGITSKTLREWKAENKELRKYLK